MAYQWTMPSRVAPISIPDDFNVYVASDLHGQLAAVDRLLGRAGLTDGGATWTAPPRTALVVTGDLVDRGPDSVGLVRRLAALRDQAPALGGMVVLLEGNHEVQLLGGLAGVPEVFRAFMTFGGAATLQSAGLAEADWRDASASLVATRFDAAAPDVRSTVWSFAPYARWRDVLLVHGGPVPGQALDAFEGSARRLWIRHGFFASDDPFPGSTAWTPYRRAGMERVVFGHTPVATPTLFHTGRALNLDTWRGQAVSLAALTGESLADAQLFSEPAQPRAVADAPVTPEEVARLDASLPPVVDRWWLGERGPLPARRA
jgi:serine/threonine protein phosphatase 1